VRAASVAQRQRVLSEEEELEQRAVDHLLQVATSNAHSGIANAVPVLQMPKPYSTQQNVVANIPVQEVCLNDALDLAESWAQRQRMLSVYLQERDQKRQQQLKHTLNDTHTTHTTHTPEPTWHSGIYSRLVSPLLRPRDSNERHTSAAQQCGGGEYCDATPLAPEHRRVHMLLWRVVWSWLLNCRHRLNQTAD
jgi:hypothetical protein